LIQQQQQQQQHHHHLKIITIIIINDIIQNRGDIYVNNLVVSETIALKTVGGVIDGVFSFTNSFADFEILSEPSSMFDSNSRHHHHHHHHHYHYRHRYYVFPKLELTCYLNFVFRSSKKKVKS
jgi:hypothetical protein